MNVIKVYGADWCEDTQATRAHLDALGMAYQYINVDADPQAKVWIKAQNNGKQQTPTVDIGGRILIEPDEDELDEAIRRPGSKS
ncbi:MAG: glutaredoxin family protein [Tepidisphaeraceae bacterium]